MDDDEREGRQVTRGMLFGCIAAIVLWLVLIIIVGSLTLRGYE